MPRSDRLSSPLWLHVAVSDSPPLLLPSCPRPPACNVRRTAPIDGTSTAALRSDVHHWAAHRQDLISLKMSIAELSSMPPKVCTPFVLCVESTRTAHCLGHWVPCVGTEMRRCVLGGSARCAWPRMAAHGWLCRCCHANIPTKAECTAVQHRACTARTVCTESLVCTAGQPHGEDAKHGTV